MNYVSDNKYNYNIIVFIIFIALAKSVILNIVGLLTLSDIVLLAIFPIVFFRVWPNFIEIKLFYLFAGTWILSCITTDIYRQSAFEDYSRGLAMILFFIINFGSISALCNWKIDRIIIFIFILYVSTSIYVYNGGVENNNGANFFGNNWKFGYGILFTFFVLVISTFLMRKDGLRIIGMILPFLAMAFNLYLNARSLAGVTAIAAVANVMVGRPGRASSPVKIFISLLICAFGGYIVIEIYKYVASSGLIGEAAQLKYFDQSKYNLNIILSGRTEFLASSQAIIDSPIFGHGSWAKNSKYFELMLSEIEKAGGERIYVSSDLIPTHSHIFGAWVQNGIGGALFWIAILILCAKSFYKAISRASMFSGLTVFISVNMIWDILFSPFGLGRRVVDPAIICYMITVLNEEKLRAGVPNIFQRSRANMRILGQRPVWPRGAFSGRMGSIGRCTFMPLGSKPNHSID